MRLIQRSEKKVAVVYDLEYTAWEGVLKRAWGSQYEDLEVIQIVAVQMQMFQSG